MEFFQFPKLFSTNAQIRRKKSNFRDKPYWRPYNCEVRMRIEGGLFINEGSRVYSTPIRSPFKKHLCHLAKICEYVCLLYTFNCDCSLFLFFCHWHFCWIWLLFTRKLQANKKLIHFCKHSKKYETVVTISVCFSWKTHNAATHHRVLSLLVNIFLFLQFLFGSWLFYCQRVP